MNGKILQIEDTNSYLTKGNRIYLINSGKRTKGFFIKGWNYSWASFWFLTRRLLRAEFTGLYRTNNKSDILIAKKGLFLKKTDNEYYKLIFNVPRGSKPLNLCVHPNGHIFFGEYFQNMERQAVNIYGSIDNGRSWNIVYSFGEGNINHIHGLFYDKYTDRVWVLTGDRENECIIGYTEDEFKTFVEVFRGGQEYRSCQLFFYRDFIVFATDSQYMENEIKFFDRKSLEIHTITKIQGSAIKGGQYENVSFLSTTVEPSQVNTDKYAHVWMTRDGLHWHEVYSAKKDWWPSVFQFGTFEFPQYLSPITDTLYCTGRALQGYDGRTISIDISNV